MESCDKICPDDVLVDIFSRLDVEYLMGLKPWYRPISDSCVPTIPKRLSPRGIHFRNAAMSLMVHGEVSTTYVPLSGKNVRARFHQEELEEACLDKQFMGYVSISSSTEEAQQLEMNFYHYYSNLFAHLLQFEYSNQAQNYVEDSRNSIPKAQVFLKKKRVVCLSLRKVVDNTVFGGFRLGIDIFSSESSMWEQHQIHLDIPVEYFTLKRNPGFLLNMTGKELESCVKKMDDTDSFGEICPDDVLVDIFFRLEVKDLMRLKCVSKPWYRLISDSCVPTVSKQLSPCGIHFRTAAMSLKVYDELASEYVWMNCMRRDHVRKRFYSELETCFDRQFMGYASMEEEEEEEKNLYAHLLPFEHGSKAQDLVDSRSGLLLFSKESSALGEYYYYVCNPTTNQCVSIPPKPASHNHHYHHHHHRLEKRPFLVHAALAFDPAVSPHYRVVCLSVEEEQVGLLGIDIFSSESVMWERHQVEELGIPIEYFAALKRNSVLLDGVLYMLSLSWKVIRFDINSLEFRVIDLPIPDIIWGKKGYKGCLGLFHEEHYRGCLGLAARGRVYYSWLEGDYVRLWSFNHQGGGFVWTLEHTADCSSRTSRIYVMDDMKMERYTVWVLPCGVHPNAEAIFLGTTRCIFLYHFKTDELQLLHKASERQVLPLCFYSVFLYCRCLVPLNHFSSSTGGGQGKKHFSLTGEEEAPPITRAFSFNMDGEEA